MEKKDINYELISKIEIHVQNTLFYLPGETIKGKIILHPQYKIKEEILHLTLKIKQYEFWDYINQEIKELKNIYTTLIQEENIEYKLTEEELPKKENFEGFERFSIIMQEDKDKIISIPFEIKLDDKKILPTFQYQKDVYFLGIRHLILVECKEYNASNYTGLFIGKNKNIELSEPKEIKESYMVGLGSLEIIANFPKLSIAKGEAINVDIETNSNLHFKKITRITQTFYRDIKWVGYMKNTLLDKYIYNSSSTKYNENKYNILEKLTLPITPIIESFKSGIMTGFEAYVICSGALGNMVGAFLTLDEDDDYEVSENPVQGLVGGIIAAPFGMVRGFFEGFSEQGKIIKECLNCNKRAIGVRNNFKNKIHEGEKLQLIENIKKFVYFKDNKVVGFIKFAQNITPNVNGYYFNCEYNMKISVDIAGIIIDRNKYLKTQFDLYDSEEYIAHMKNLFKN